jgi:hypothetical protein
MKRWETEGTGGKVTGTVDKHCQISMSATDCSLKTLHKWEKEDKEWF